MKPFFLLCLATLVVGCSAPGTRFGHSKEPMNLGGGQYLVEGYRLATGLERAREFCGNKEMVTMNIMRPLNDYEWTKIIFICK
jgi:hypothetical protein